jgi:DNA-binding CsgD family transcriptional regulator
MKEILKWLAKGLCYKEIAAEFNILLETLRSPPKIFMKDRICKAEKRT